MKLETFQIKLKKTKDSKEKIFTFRKISALGVMKKTGVPIPEEGEEMDPQEMTKMAPQILEAICLKPAELQDLTFVQIAQLMSDKEYMEYMRGIFGIDKDNLGKKK